VSIAVMLLKPSVSTNNNNIAIVQTVSAREVLNKMVLKLEDLKKDANLAFMHYKYSSNEKSDFTNKDIYIYKDLAGKRYSEKIIRTANQEIVSKTQEDGSVVTQYFSQQTSYTMNDGDYNYGLTKMANDPYTLDVVRTRETDNAIVLGTNPLKNDPIEVFSNNYKLITDNLDLVSTDNAELIEFDLNGEKIPAYKIEFSFDYQNWMYSTNSYIYSSFSTEIIISKETLLPLREVIKGFGTDNEPLQIQMDYIDFAYENRTAQEMTKVFDIETNLKTFGITDYKISDRAADLNGNSYNMDKEVTYTGKIIAKNIYEKYVLPTIKDEKSGKEIFLEGDHMYDWLAEKPTAIGYYLIGKKVEVTGYKITGYYDELIVTSFKVID
jgi:hypothetical protein